jgi:hypothetical protein
MAKSRRRQVKPLPPPPPPPAKVKESAPRQSERPMLWITLAGVGVALFAGFGGWYAGMTADNAARETLARGQHNTEIYLGKQKIPSEVNVFFAIPKKVEKVAMGTLPINISNAGGATIEGAYLQLAYPFNFLAAGDEFSKYFDCQPIGEPLKCERHAQAVGSQLYVTYSLGSLNPGQTANVNDPFSVQETHSSTFEIKEYGIHFEVDFSWTLPIFVTAKDTPARFVQFHMYGIRSDDFQVILDYAQEMMKAQARDLRKQLGWMGYALRALSGQQESCVIVMPKHDQEAGPGSTYMKISNDNLTFINFDSYPISELF